LHDCRIDENDAGAKESSKMPLEHGVMRAAEDECFEIEWEMRADLGYCGASRFAIERTRLHERNECRRRNFDDVHAADSCTKGSAVRAGADRRGGCDDSDAKETAAFDGDGG
jgi:hypothetical protein